MTLARWVGSVSRETRKGAWLLLVNIAECIGRLDDSVATIDTSGSSDSWWCRRTDWRDRGLRFALSLTLGQNVTLSLRWNMASQSVLQLNAI